MNFPLSFNVVTRGSLVERCLPVSAVGIHSYEFTVIHDSTVGANLLANAVEDDSRQHRPMDWHAMLLLASADSPQALADKLLPLNDVSPLKPLIEAQRMAQSIATSDNDRMKRGNGQSIEWFKYEDCRAIPALKAAFIDASKSLTTSEGTAAVSDIDSALTELKALKIERDSRLTLTNFEAVNIDIEVTHFTANSAESLAASIRSCGNNKQHWAYCLFVGNENEIKPIKELFL